MRWAKIKGYDDYLISEKGQVKNIISEDFLKITNNGFRCQVYLFKNGEQACKGVGRLVAEAFIPNPNNYKFVYHKDKNHSNNNIDNLVWTKKTTHHLGGGRLTAIGDLEYFKKIQNCECCKKNLPRSRFSTQYKDDSGLIRGKVLKVCNDCREDIKGNQSEHVKWGKRGQKAEDITRPSIIDLMESYRERI